MKGFDRLWLHPGQRPAAVDARLNQALTQLRLPPRLLYDSHAQAGRWLRYHEAWSPARTDPRVEALYPSLGRHLRARPFVSFGCGGGRKDLAILHAGRGQRYLAVDTSVALAVGSAAAASDAGFDATALVMDLEAPAKRSAFGDDPVVFGALGLVPNFELDALGRTLAELLRPGDGLMLSANLGSAEDPTVHAQYDNPEARRWMMGGLLELGLDAGALSVRVEGRRLDRVLTRIEAKVRLNISQTIELPFHRAEWPAETEFVAFFSNRLAPVAAGERLGRAVGRAPVDQAETAVEGVYWFEA